MGYCIEVEESNFKIKKENISNILNVLKAFANSRIGGFRWVNTRTVLEANSIEEIFEEIRYPLHQDDNGDYEIDYFSGEKLGDDFEIFRSIARYVEDGSYIEYLGEDGCRWKYVFKDGKLSEKLVELFMMNDFTE